MPLAAPFRLAIAPAAVALAAATFGAAPAAAHATHRAATVSGTVWLDINGNGVRDQSDSVVPGASVSIERRKKVHGHSTFVAAATKTTGPPGTWSYTVRSTAAYRVSVTLPAVDDSFSPKGKGSKKVLGSDVSAGGLSAVHTLSKTSKPVVVNAGLVPRPSTTIDPMTGRPTTPGVTPTPTATPTPGPGSTDVPVSTSPDFFPIFQPVLPFTITGVAWLDANGDGIRESGDNGTWGINVDLMSADGTTQLASTSTNTFGGWTLTVPINTAYRVKLEPTFSGAFALSPEHRGTDTSKDSDFSRAYGGAFMSAVIPANTIVKNLDAGMGQSVKIQDLAWQDFNKDGIQDNGEPGVSGVAVELWDANRTELLAKGVSQTKGYFTLQGAFMGGSSYRIHVTVPPGATLTAMGKGTNRALDSDVITSGSLTGWTNPFTPSVANTNFNGIDVGLF